VSAALWLLLGLQIKGWFRFLGRNLRTVKGALTALLGLGAFVLWVTSVVLTPSTRRLEAEQLLLYGPEVLLLYCLANVLGSSGERAVYFSPGEVQFLFPGPFGRREVLAYKILSNLSVNALAALMTAVIVQANARWFPAAYVGVLLAFLFMQLFGMAVNLVATTVGERLYSRGRKLLFAALVLLALAALFRFGGPPSQWRPRDAFEAVARSEAWRTALLPLSWFFRAFLAAGPRELAEYGLLGLLVNLALVGVVFALDAQYLESAASSSARIYARLQRRRGRSADGGDGPSRKARLSVPTLPYWGGVGPIFWRQLTTAMRGLGRLVIVLLIIGVFVVGPMLSRTTADEEVPLPWVVGGMILWLTVFLTALAPFDFRGDVDRIAVLKTLPVPAWRLAVGQLLTPVLLFTLLQCGVLAALASGAPHHPEAVLACAAYTLPFNFLLFALENLLFLLFPTRLAAATPGDFQTMGRNVLFLLGKVLALGVVAGAAGIVGGLAGYITDSRWVGLIAAWPVVAVSGAALVPFVALAFQAFDVGRDTPP
jgi:hypothetical protein